MILTIPAVTPVTRPTASTDATDVSDDVHNPPTSPLESKSVVAPMQTVAIPETVPAFGALVTVTRSVAMEIPVHGAVAVTV